LNATGSALVFSTFLGGSSSEYREGLAVDPAGSVYVAGITESADFPVTPGAYSTVLSQGKSLRSDYFVSKLSGDGSSLLYSTYLGSGGPDGPGTDIWASLCVNAAGEALLCGTALAADFPTTPGAYQTAHAGGGDIFVTRLNAAGTGLLLSTFIGSPGDDYGAGIAEDANGIYILASGTWLPVVNPVLQGAHAGGTLGEPYVAHLDRTGSTLLFADYLGGTDYERPQQLALDPTGAILVTGHTRSADFTTHAALDPTYNGGNWDAFVAKIDTVTLPATAAAPTGLTASAPSGPVTLSWNPAPGAVLYRVYRATRSGGPYALLTAVKGTSYLDRTVAPLTTYHYVVAGYNGGGEGNPSAEASVTTIGYPGDPQSPTSLVAKAGTRQITLTWVQSSSAGIRWNRVYRSSTRGGPYTLLAEIPATTSYTTPSTAGVQYYFVVSALNYFSVESRYSKEVSARARC
jgi:hypothetical protein